MGTTKFMGDSKNHRLHFCRFYKWKYLGGILGKNDEIETRVPHFCALDFCRDLGAIHHDILSSVANRDLDTDDIKVRNAGRTRVSRVT